MFNVGAGSAQGNEVRHNSIGRGTTVKGAYGLRVGVMLLAVLFFSDRVINYFQHHGPLPHRSLYWSPSTIPRPDKVLFLKTMQCLKLEAKVVVS